MEDKLVDRLRGNYSVGPANIYGTRSFAEFIPPICLEAADRIEKLEAVLRRYAKYATKEAMERDIKLLTEVEP